MINTKYLIVKIGVTEHHLHVPPFNMINFTAFKELHNFSAFTHSR